MGPSEVMQHEQPSLPTQNLSKDFLFQLSREIIHFYRLSHSEIVDIEKMAIRSSLRLPNNKCALIETSDVYSLVFTVEDECFLSQHQYNALGRLNQKDIKPIDSLLPCCLLETLREIVSKLSRLSMEGGSHNVRNGWHPKDSRLYGGGDIPFQLKSDSLLHAHVQTTKTYYKHQDSRIKNQESRKLKIQRQRLPQTLIYKIFLQYIKSIKGDWNGYLRKGRKTKPKRQNRTRNGKDCERQSQIEAEKSIKSKSQQKSQLVKVKVNT
ncbi:hypothetical protein Tco_0389891, partial [Tanacetum coccineum]